MLWAGYDKSGEKGDKKSRIGERAKGEERRAARGKLEVQTSQSRSGLHELRKSEIEVWVSSEVRERVDVHGEAVTRARYRRLMQRVFG